LNPRLLTARYDATSSAPVAPVSGPQPTPPGACPHCGGWPPPRRAASSSADGPARPEPVARLTRCFWRRADTGENLGAGNILGTTDTEDQFCKDWLKSIAAGGHASIQPRSGQAAARAPRGCRPAAVVVLAAGTLGAYLKYRRRLRQHHPGDGAVHPRRPNRPPVYSTNSENLLV